MSRGSVNCGKKWKGACCSYLISMLSTENNVKLLHYVLHIFMKNINLCVNYEWRRFGYLAYFVVMRQILLLRGMFQKFVMPLVNKKL